MAEPPLLVPEAISIDKLAREVALWREHEPVHRRQGLVLSRHDGLEVDLLVLAPGAPLPMAAAAVRLRFDNYDLWPPSLAFADPFTGELLPPGVMPTAVPQDVRENPPRSLLPGPHPATGTAFLCVPGTREYHTHDEHTGDHWLRYRRTGPGQPGTLQGIATTLHKTISATVRGVVVQTGLLLTPSGQQIQLAIGLLQGPADPMVVDVTDGALQDRPVPAGAAR